MGELIYAKRARSAVPDHFVKVHIDPTKVLESPEKCSDTYARNSHESSEWEECPAARIRKIWGRNLGISSGGDGGTSGIRNKRAAMGVATV